MNPIRARLSAAQSEARLPYLARSRPRRWRGRGLLMGREQTSVLGTRDVRN